MTPNAILFFQTFSADQVSAYASDLSSIPSALQLFDDAKLHLKWTITSLVSFCSILLVQNWYKLTKRLAVPIQNWPIPISPWVCIHCVPL